MRNGTIAVVGGRPRIVKALAALGHTVVSVQKPGTDVTAFTEHCEAVYSVDYTDDDVLRGFATTVLARLSPSAVISYTETGLRPAAVARQALGLPGTPVEVVETFNDKALTRSAVLEAGLLEHTIDFSVPASAAEAEEFALPIFNRHGTVIAKPRTGTASKDVAHLVSLTDLQSLQFDGKLVLEEFVSGIELSVETVTFHGEHTIAGVTEKIVGTNFIELGHVIPPRAVSPDVIERVCQATCAILDALKLPEGPAHTELIWTGERAVLVETHCRPGGDRIGELVRLTSGLDMMLVSATGADPWMTPTSDRPAAAIAFAVAAPGRVDAVTVPSAADDGEHVTVDSQVYLSVGDLVQPLRSSFDRVGHVLVTGTNAASTLDRAQLLAAQITYETNNDC